MAVVDYYSYSYNSKENKIICIKDRCKKCKQGYFFDWTDRVYDSYRIYMNRLNLFFYEDHITVSMNSPKPSLDLFKERLQNALLETIKKYHDIADSMSSDIPTELKDETK